MNESFEINGQLFESDGEERGSDDALAFAAKHAAQGKSVFLESTGHAAIGDGVFYFVVWVATGCERYQ